MTGGTSWSPLLFSSLFDISVKPLFIFEINRGTPAGWMDFRGNGQQPPFLSGCLSTGAFSDGKISEGQGFLQTRADRFHSEYYAAPSGNRRANTADSSSCIACNRRHNVILKTLCYNERRNTGNKDSGNR